MSFLASKLSPLSIRRIHNFKQNKRGMVSLYILLFTFALSLLAPLIANHKPILVKYQNNFYFPLWQSIPETTFDGFLLTETDYSDPEIATMIKSKGYIVHTLIPYSPSLAATDLPSPAPSPPDNKHWLGTDSHARDLLSRLLYSVRTSLLFALSMTLFVTIIGLFVGLIQGYWGGLTDLLGQRFIEILNGMPVLFLIIILSRMLKPNFWSLVFILSFFGWSSIAAVVRAETLRTRNLDYVRAAKALGLPDITIMLKHILPNSIVASLALIPFIPSASIATLASLDFLGFGLPPDVPSIGEIIRQGKNNLHAPWIALSVFFTTTFILALMIFIGEAFRDAFDPRKINL